MAKPFLAAGLVGLILLTLTTLQPAFAAWPTDPYVNVPLCTAATYQSRPAVTTDGAGGAIVTWQDGRMGGVYAQHVMATGAPDPTWPVDGRALTSVLTYGYTPKLVPDGLGGAIVTWSDDRSGSSHAYAQHILVSGEIDPNWPQDGRALSTAPYVEGTTIVGDGAGGAIVTWYDVRSGTNADIYAQHVLGSGALDPAWPADGLAVCAAAKSQYFPLIVSDGARGAIVTWRDERNSPAGGCGCGIPDVYAQHVLASGAVDPAWPADGRGLCTADSSQYPSSIIGDGAGGAIVSWFDQRSGNFDIYAQHVLGGGAIDPAWPSNGRALCTAPNDQFSTGMVADGTGGALVSWYDGRSGNDDIYAEHVLASGVVDPAWPMDGRALCTAAGDQDSYDMVSDGASGAIVTWNDPRDGQLHVYAQHVLAGGSVDPGWPADGRAICLALGGQTDIAATSDGTGGAIFAWEDSRNNDYDIYAQRVRPNGQLGGDVVGVEGSGNTALLLAPRSNPSSGSRVSVRFTLPTVMAATLDWFDVAGHRLGSREVGSLGAGTHSLDLDTVKRLAPGLYFLRLRQGPNVRVSRVAVTD